MFVEREIKKERGRKKESKEKVKTKKILKERKGKHLNHNNDMNKHDQQETLERQTHFINFQLISQLAISKLSRVATG